MKTTTKKATTKTAIKPKAAAYVAAEQLPPVLDALEASLGYESHPADEFKSDDPISGLLLTLLSQNTNDRNRDKAFDNLRAHYPTWDEVAALPASEISSLIRVAGLGDTKAARMKQILDQIKADFGEHSLAQMKSWEPDRVRAYLGNLPGIGPKTVACVMIFDLDMPAFPVDTHVARISCRLGWFPPKTSPEKIQAHLETVMPPARCRGAHLNMIEHGRRVCHARTPQCRSCVILDFCPTGKEAAAGGA